MQHHSSIQQDLIKQFLKTRIENEESFFSHPSYQLEQKLLYWVKQADIGQAKSILLQINSLARARLADNPIRSLKNSLICSCTILTRATIKAGVPSEYAFNLSDVFIRHIEKVTEVDFLHELEYEILETFIHAILDFKKTSYYHEIVDQAVSFIHHNILQNTTLESVSEKINVSPNYLSTLFREKVGINFKEYVNRKKIEESKYFLLHTKSTLLDIALLFGYCNQSHYTSLFKKYNGLTPKQYKRSQIANLTLAKVSED